MDSALSGINSADDLYLSINLGIAVENTAKMAQSILINT